MSPLDSALLEAIDGHFVVSSVLIHNGRLYECGYIMRGIRWEEDLLDYARRYSRIALLASDVVREYVLY